MRKLNIFIIVSIVVMIITGSVVAQSPIIVAEEATFWDKILNLFRTTEFTVVGQQRHCEVYPSREWLNIQPGTQFNENADKYCSSGYGLFDVFVDNYIPKFEMKNKALFNCGSGNQKCIVELYCCPHPECTSDSQCESWEGTGSDCEISYVTDPYMPLVDGSGITIISYKYCTTSCAGSPINCWRITNNVCEKRTYECDYATYPNCPTSYPYTSLSSCEADIPTNGNGETCSELGTDLNACKARTDCVYTRNFLCKSLSDVTCENVMYETGCDKKTNCEWSLGVCRLVNGNGNGETCEGQGGECTWLSCPLEYKDIGKYDCGLAKTCCKLKSEIFWETTIALDINELEDLTSTQLLDALCKSKENCPTNSTCKIIERLIEKDYVTSTQMSFVRRDYCDQKTAWERFFADVDESCAYEWRKNTYFRNHYGLCVIEEEKVGWCGIAEKLAFFEITKDKCTDGSIILIGVLLLFMIIYSKMLYGRFENEI